MTATEATNGGEPPQNESRPNKRKLDNSQNENVENSKSSNELHANNAGVSETVPNTQEFKFPERETALYVSNDSKSRVSFVVVENDNSPTNLTWLINLKEIFAKQLPKMPKEYIARLVLDRSHRSMLAIRQDKVVGGICFRPYFEQRFGEIAFCAVSADEQVKGYGTKLMNQLKEYVKTINLTHFLTYADNYAIGYFKKQGFTMHISMPRERWMGYIKDYDGGTLMECVINQYVDYLRVPEMISKQRSFVLEQIKRLSKANRTYPGLQLFADGLVVSNPYTEIPGLAAAGWRAQNTGIRKAVKPPSVLQGALQGVYRQVHAHKDSWPFHEPVAETVQDYLEIVKTPIDLSLIKRRLDAGGYSSKETFRKDLILMCDNCKLYNGPDTNFYKCAVTLNDFANALLDRIDEAALAKVEAGESISFQT